MSRSHPGRERALAFLLALAFVLAFAACGDGRAASPRWVPLARGFAPRALLALAQDWQRAAGLDAASLQEGPWHVRVEQALPRSAWVRGAAPDTWTAPIPLGAMAYGAPRFLQLRSETPPLAMLRPGQELAANTARLEHGRLVLRLAPGAEPPEGMLLTQRLESGRATSDGLWQVRIDEEYCAGLAVWSGCAEELACELPAESRLTFTARYQSSSDGVVTLRVRLDGEVVHESVEPAALLGEQGSRQSFRLPPSARASARLAFEVQGPPGQALFLNPLVGPAEIGSPGARPWPESRADIVLLLADTFRADSLALAGGASDLTPALNAFAEHALRFPNARSNASWTLPSIGTLLSGLAPGQHTANQNDRALPGELTTVVEALAQAGYRTGAVTDAAFFAPPFGLDQGFETFAMRQPAGWDLDWTVRRALEFLAEDDGRPVFLVVHTYRTHMPYRVGAEEDLGPWKELLADGCALLQQKGRIPREEWRQRLAGCRARYRALYQAGVRDLDRGFGELLVELERSGLLQRGYVLFTSDHGEALGENDDLFHDGKLWETKLRVPLLVRGPGLAPRAVDSAVTLLDLAPTLAEIAGLPRDPRWPGSSLLARAPERPACAFLLKKEPQVSIVEDGHKLFAADPGALARGECDAAYDLARDPQEEHAVTGEAWPGELARRHAALVRALLTPASAAVEVPLSHAQQAELDQLGYGGEGADK